jgi:FtsH-binding integral membrane protein
VADALPGPSVLRCPSYRDQRAVVTAVMLYLALKAVISGVLIAVASTLAKRYPGFGALIASLPLVSVLGMIWLWNEKPDAENMAAHAGATFWYVLPSLPMFLLIPALLRHGVGFWVALAAGCGLTMALYAAMTWIAPRFGLQL